LLSSSFHLQLGIKGIFMNARQGHEEASFLQENNGGNKPDGRDKDHGQNGASPCRSKAWLIKMH